MRLALPLVLMSLPALAQDLPDLGLDGPPTPEDVARLTETIRGLAADALLVGDVLGAEVTGTDGEALGTVEDLVALPGGGAATGGTLVAAILRTPGGERLAVPYAVIEVGTSAAAPALSLPFSASEVTGLEGLSELAAELAPSDGG